METLLTCKPGFEKTLAREIELSGLAREAHGPGWVLARTKAPGPAPAPALPLGELCFACEVLQEPAGVEAASVNRLADALLKAFTAHLGAARVETPWAFRFLSSAEEGPLAQHAATVEECWAGLLKRKMSRVAGLGQPGIPSGPDWSEGFFVHFADFNRARVSFRAFSQGQQRMKMDPRAPSRSYLKLEEAFHIFGRAPAAGEQVVDLGAAPGGWSHAALKRGAAVTAVDNGPLRDPVRSHPNVRHLKSDALKYRPDRQTPADWLLCDILERPEMVLELLRKWLEQKWCRRFIANLKVGRMDPLAVLKDVRDPRRGLAPFCRVLRARQLYHDREEITLMGEIKEPK